MSHKPLLLLYALGHFRHDGDSPDPLQRSALQLAAFEERGRTDGEFAEVAKAPAV